MNFVSKVRQAWIQLLQNDTQPLCITRIINNVARIKTVLKNSFNWYHSH